MVEKIKFGVIGCSDIAQRITIPAILNSKNAELVMLGSRDIDKAKKWSLDYGINDYGTYDDVLKNKKIDAVYISLPFSLQAEWSIAASNAKKHILCEKSATTSFDSALSVVKNTRRNNVRILEAFMFRFHPQHKKFLELINENIAGNIHTMEAKFGLIKNERTGFRFDKRLGGSGLNDMGCYLICASRIIFQDEPIAVLSNMTLDNNGIDYRGNFSLIFPDNKISFCTYGYDYSYQSTYSIWGTKALMGLNRAYAIKSNTNSVLWIQSDDGYKEIEIPWTDQSKLMIEEFSDVIGNNLNGSFNYEDDLISQARIMESIRISSKEKRLVKFNEF